MTNAMTRLFDRSERSILRMADAILEFRNFQRGDFLVSKSDDGLRVFYGGSVFAIFRLKYDVFNKTFWFKGGVCEVNTKLSYVPGEIISAVNEVFSTIHVNYRCKVLDGKIEVLRFKYSTDNDTMEVRSM
jgi:hypothetical protein